MPSETKLSFTKAIESHVIWNHVIYQYHVTIPNISFSVRADSVAIHSRAAHCLTQWCGGYKTGNEIGNIHISSWATEMWDAQVFQHIFCTISIKVSYFLTWLEPYNPACGISWARVASPIPLSQTMKYPDPLGLSWSRMDWACYRGTHLAASYLSQ